MNEDKIQEIYNLIPEGYLNGTDELKEIISSEGLDGAYNLIPSGYYDNKSNFLSEFESSFTKGSVEQQEQPTEPLKESGIVSEDLIKSNLNNTGEPLVLSKTKEELTAEKLYQDSIKEYSQEDKIALKELQDKSRLPEKTIDYLSYQKDLDVETAKKSLIEASSDLNKRSELIQQKQGDLSQFLEMVKKEESLLIKEQESNPDIVFDEIYKSKVDSIKEMYNEYNSEAEKVRKDYLIFYNKSREVNDYSKFLQKKQESIDENTREAVKDLKKKALGISGYLGMEAIGSALNFTESFLVAGTAGFAAQPFDEGESDDSFVTPEKIKNKLSELERLGYSESQIASYKKAMSHKIKTQERNKEIKSNLVKFGMDRVESANIRTKDWALTNSLSKIDSSNPLDYLAFAINASAEVAPQLILSKATGGLGTFVATSGSMYIDAVSRQVDAEMEKSGSTREDAFEVVMSDTKVNKLGLNAGALVVAGLDYAGSLSILGGASKEAKKKLVKEMLDDVVLSRTGKLLKIGGQLVKGEATEIGTELIQEGVESESTSMSIGNKFGEGLKEFTVDETLDLIAKVAIGSSGPQVIQAVANNNFSNNLIKSIANDFEAKTFAFEQIDARILKGDITEVQADQIKGRIDKKMAHVKDLSKMISEDKLEDAMVLQEEWDSLEEQITTNQTGLKSLLKSKQKEVQTKLEELANQTEKDGIQDDKTELQKGGEKETKEVDRLRADEQSEMLKEIPNSKNALTDGKVDREKLPTNEDKTKFDEIYDKYDKLISPLLKVIDEKETKKVDNVVDKAREEIGATSLLSESISRSTNSGRQGLISVSDLEDYVGEDRVGNAAMSNSRQTIDKLKDDISKNGFKESIIIKYDKQKGIAAIIEGNHRYVAAKELGLKSVPVRIEKGSIMSNEQRANNQMFPIKGKVVGTDINDTYGVSAEQIGLKVEKPSESDYIKQKESDSKTESKSAEKSKMPKDTKSKAFDSIDSIAEKLKKALKVDIPEGRKTQGAGVSQNDIIDLASRAVKALVGTGIDVKVAIDKVISELKSQGIFNVFDEKSITDALSNKESKPKAKSVYSETRGMSEREYFTQGFEEVYSSLRNKISEIKNKYKEEIKNLKEDSNEKKLAERELIAKLSLSIEAILPKSGSVSRSIAIQLSKANTEAKVNAVIDRLEKLSKKEYEKQSQAIKNKAASDILKNLLNPKSWIGAKEKNKPRKKKLTDDTINVLKDMKSIYNEETLSLLSTEKVVALQKEISEIISESKKEIKSLDSAKKKVRKGISLRFTEMIARKNNKKKPLNSREDAIKLLKLKSVVIVDGITFNSLKDFQLAYPEGTEISGESIYIPSQPGLSISGLKSRLWSRFSKITDLQGMIETFIQSDKDKSFVVDNLLKPASDKFYGKDRDIQKLDKARRTLASEVLNDGKGLFGKLSKVARLYEKSGVSFVNNAGVKSLELTNDNAIYLYNAFKQLDGVEKFINGGYSLNEVSAVIDYINSNKDLKVYADGLNSIYSAYLPSINESLINNGFESIAETNTKSKAELSEEKGQDFANKYYEVLSKIYGGEQNIPIIEKYSPISVASKEIDSMQNTNIFDSKKFNISTFAPNVFERVNGGSLNIRSSTSVFNSYSNSMTNMVHSLELLKRFQAFMSTENKRLIIDNYGSDFYKSLENSMNDIIYGQAKSTMSDSESTSSLNQWLNNANASVMFLNFKSAATQLLSATNFALESDITFSDYMNNALNYSSKEMTQARKELSENLAIEYRGDKNTSSIEIDALRKSEFGDQDVSQNVGHFISSVLSKGYFFTSKADVFAIKVGGAPYYMIKRDQFYEENLASGMDKNEAYEDAKDRAAKKTYEAANKTQQSSNLDRISAEQKNPMSRLLLTFGTVSMQYNREIISAARDIKNGRGDLSNNIGRIIYYSTIQNLIFQVISAAFGDIGDDEEEKTKASTILNRSVDSLLKGFGVYGVAASATKNALYDIYSYVKRVQDSDGELSSADKKFLEDVAGIDFNQKTYREPLKILLNTMSSISPAIGSKLKQAVGVTYQAGNGEATKAALNSVNLATNIPVERLLDLSDAMNSDLSGFHRMARLTNIMKNYEVEKALEKEKEVGSKSNPRAIGRSRGGRDNSGRTITGRVK